MHYVLRQVCADADRFRVWRTAQYVFFLDAICVLAVVEYSGGDIRVSSMMGGYQEA